MKICHIIALIIFVTSINNAQSGLIQGIYGRLKNTTLAIRENVHGLWSIGKDIVLGEDKKPSNDTGEAGDSEKNIIDGIVERTRNAIHRIENAVHNFLDKDGNNTSFVSYIYGKMKKRLIKIKGAVISIRHYILGNVQNSTQYENFHRQQDILKNLTNDNQQLIREQITRIWGDELRTMIEKVRNETQIIKDSIDDKRREVDAKARDAAEKEIELLGEAYNKTATAAGQAQKVNNDQLKNNKPVICRPWTIESILNIALHGNQLIQVTLPIRYDGLGIRRLCDIGVFASLVSVRELVELAAIYYDLMITKLSELEIVSTPRLVVAIIATTVTNSGTADDSRPGWPVFRSAVEGSIFSSSSLMCRRLQLAQSKNRRPVDVPVPGHDIVAVVRRGDREKEFALIELQSVGWPRSGPGGRAAPRANARLGQCPLHFTLSLRQDKMPYDN
ncbi:hypothetical protein EVAR_17298_1 [Eumeta japonica]|uniref:Uncharacterized protein n=1 Tax=Eumeta variegata TaxID=151549 RepID=A0A4C1TT51_EUMVA|nr:hypothetical protein EVAR_17298_1 [Eumeta japonica]